jgi:hypothetical protein
MITTIVVIGLLGGGFFYALRMGKKMEQLDQFEEGQEKLGSVSEFNRKLDEETDAKINSGDGPVSGPWLR